ncbi:hypothetical protein RSK60_1750004 [Ralstonia solanacearum K60]|nr:hypothetical protein RSK60_1750004 [Ralstonia solanacearum K60]
MFRASVNLDIRLKRPPTVGSDRSPSAGRIRPMSGQGDEAARSCHTTLRVGVPYAPSSGLLEATSL